MYAISFIVYSTGTKALMSRSLFHNPKEYWWISGLKMLRPVNTLRAKVWLPFWRRHLEKHSQVWKIVYAKLQSDPIMKRSNITIYCIKHSNDEVWTLIWSRTHQEIPNFTQIGELLDVCHINGIAQDCSISIAIAPEIHRKSCTKPSICSSEKTKSSLGKGICLHNRYSGTGSVCLLLRAYR